MLVVEVAALLRRVKEHRVGNRTIADGVALSGTAAGTLKKALLKKAVGHAFFCCLTSDPFRQVLHRGKERRTFPE